MGRAERKQIAAETLDILRSGLYQIAGNKVLINDSLQSAIRGTQTYTPEVLDALLAKVRIENDRFATEFPVDNETSFAAARRLTLSNADLNPFCLNFASAKNPGGGFLNGAKAQEECLARASGLFACLEPAKKYYEVNRKCGTSLYTHHMIYSPQVPVFRDDEDKLLATPYLISILTAPAVNAGAVMKNEPDRRDEIEPSMLQRAERLLAVAHEHQHDTLILGAWGCGVFRNDPRAVAECFQTLLSGQFSGVFRKVEFAVPDSTADLTTYRAFADVFAS